MSGADFGLALDDPRRNAVRYAAGDDLASLSALARTEGLRVLDEAARKFGIDLHFDHFDFSSWDYYEKHGKMLPDNWKDQIGGHEAIYFGAVGWPDKVPDHVSLWGSLLQFRRRFLIPLLIEKAKTHLLIPKNAILHHLTEQDILTGIS